MKNNMMILFAALIALRAAAYGPEGHQLVGAIADARLKDTPAAATISSLLDGITLERAATLADEIKSWDRHPDDAVIKDHPKLEAQLRAFHDANDRPPGSPTNRPSHHWFHYTDVPVEGGEKYADGTEGRSEWDVVHIIPFCAGVLDGSIKEDNERKITKPVAVILLAHFVGDIHQPLHVGAEFFGALGKPVHPDGKNEVIGDKGGNSFKLHYKPGTHADGTSVTNFHAFWDITAAMRAIEMMHKDFSAANAGHTNAITNAELGTFLAKHEPSAWKTDAPVSALSTNWADEILPIARQAHERVEFSSITIRGEGERRGLEGVAKEKPQADGTTYLDWSGGVVKDELQKAGWRLAELFTHLVK
jgi:hypothetical protein